jgi:hypothetical protein
MVRVSFVLALAGALLLTASGSQAVASPNACGQKAIHGRSVDLVLVRGSLSCETVRSIVRGRCRSGRAWSCISLRPPDPLVVWFRTNERFARHRSVVIEGRRRACEHAHVSRRAWRRSAGSWDRPAPTMRQVLADDMVRCRALRGMTYDDVRALLGRPERGADSQRTFMAWEIGPERDSLFPIDGESLFLNFGPNGRFRSASMQSG